MREQSLSWWRGLTIDKQEEIAIKWFPNYTFAEITTSSSRIEEMFKLENV